jgi:hypothetical protein
MEFVSIARPDYTARIVHRGRIRLGLTRNDVEQSKFHHVRTLAHAVSCWFKARGYGESEELDYSTPEYIFKLLPVAIPCFVERIMA